MLLTFGTNCVKMENEQGTFYEEFPCEGKCQEIKIKVFTNFLLNILRLMEDNLVINITQNTMVLEDSIGKYVIATEVC